MNIENILIPTTEPKSIFLEILFKYFKSKKFSKNKNNFNWRFIFISKQLI